jgi:serine/threonine-protein kinase PpkA
MKIEGYTIIRELGKGGMATVYLAIQESFKREVALKIMAPALTADPTFAERFLREARIVAHLSHPHIEAVYDVGVSHGHHFISMEYHTGGDLTSKVSADLTPTAAVDIAKQIASALDYAHANGYVHRDIKPGNVLFSHYGSAILTDFGIAKAADSSSQPTAIQEVVGSNQMTKEGSIVGTPSYMSPEQARGQAVDGRADLYSLGIVFYEMLTGTLPYQAQDQIAIAIMHISEPVPTLPGEFDRFQPLLTKLLAKDPTARFQTGTELIEAFEELERAAQPPPQAASRRVEDLPTIAVAAPVGDFGKPDRGALIKWAARGAAALVVAGVAIYALTSSGPEPTETTGASTTTTAAGTPAVPDGSPREPANDENIRNAQIAVLFQAAQAAYEADRLSSPKGDNAYEKYKEVLALDPGNRQAREGIERVADRYLTLARNAIQRQEFRTAQSYLNRVLEMAPAHPDLASTQRMLVEASDKAQSGSTRVTAALTEVRVTGLLRGAEVALAEDHLTSPEGNNAYQKYLEVLKLDPGNKDAHNGIQLIGGRYIALAEQALAQGELDKADQYLEKASTITAGHPKLAQTIKAAKAARAKAGG